MVTQKVIRYGDHSNCSERVCVRERERNRERESERESECRGLSLRTEQDRQTDSEGHGRPGTERGRVSQRRGCHSNTDSHTTERQLSHVPPSPLSLHFLPISLQIQHSSTGHWKLIQSSVRDSERDLNMIYCSLRCNYFQILITTALRLQA